MLFSFSYWNWQCHLNEFIALNWIEYIDECKRWTGAVDVLYKMIDYLKSFLHSIRSDTPSINLRTSTEIWFIFISIKKIFYFCQCIPISEHNEIEERTAYFKMIIYLGLFYFSILFVEKRNIHKINAENFQFSHQKLTTAYVAPCWLFNFIVYQKSVYFYSCCKRNCIGKMYWSHTKL